MIIFEIILKIIVWSLIEIGFIKLIKGAYKGVEKFYEWVKYEVFGQRKSSIK
ncbi:hypothetical protein [Catalinimonas niigatensis]|uniref:hypothetical protein n=1 Tax=Catalinimonas niigatensis TaxID=1397264 RepID=UPI0026655EA5|nr:hypothetical protein [Catalinimonas niigatensis]WPP49362.1 hypothetical protein PZB72_22080 [Catalinimonas niigatensis]